MGTSEFVAKLDRSVGGLGTSWQLAFEVGAVLWAESLNLWGLIANSGT